MMIVNRSKIHFWTFFFFSCVTVRTQEGQTALQLAISNQLPLVVDAICTRGADMSVVDDKGNPPLWLALENGLEDIASTLVRQIRILFPLALKSVASDFMQMNLRLNS